MWRRQRYGGVRIEKAKPGRKCIAIELRTMEREQSECVRFAVSMGVRFAAICGPFIGHLKICVVNVSLRKTIFCMNRLYYYKYTKQFMTRIVI